MYFYESNSLTGIAMHDFGGDDPETEMEGCTYGKLSFIDGKDSGKGRSNLLDV